MFKKWFLSDLAQRQALSQTLLYLLIGVVWILVSDGFLLWRVDDPERLTTLQTAKGWFFVVCTAVILYFLILRSLRKLSSLEEQIRRAERMDALGTMAGSIYHDFNNLLGVIGSYTEALTVDPGSDRAASFVDEITRAVEQGRRLNQKLRTLITDRTQKPKIQDVNEVIASNEDMLRRAVMPEMRVQLSLDASAAPVLMEEGELARALLNLGINAKQASGGDGTLAITTRVVHMGGLLGPLTTLEPGRYVVVSIKDDGSGMDEETRKHVFEPFFTTKGERGSGLGLAQVYGFVSHCRGEIQFDSKPGEGTSFHLYLPLVTESWSSA